MATKKPQAEPPEWMLKLWDKEFELSKLTFGERLELAPRITQARRDKLSKAKIELSSGKSVLVEFGELESVKVV